MAAVDCRASGRSASTETLEGIWALMLPLAERRRLCARVAVAAALAAPRREAAVCDESGGVCLRHMEEALATEAAGVGSERIGALFGSA